MRDFDVVDEVRSSGGTACYRAPELICEKPVCTNKADIWALGCILYELAAGKKAFVGDWKVYEYSITRELPQITDPTWPDNIQSHLSQNVQKLLAVDWRQRPPASIARVVFYTYERFLESGFAQGLPNHGQSFPSYLDWKRLVQRPVQLEMCRYELDEMYENEIDESVAIDILRRLVDRYLSAESFQTLVSATNSSIGSVEGPEKSSGKRYRKRSVLKANEKSRYSGSQPEITFPRSLASSYPLIKTNCAGEQMRGGVEAQEDAEDEFDNLLHKISTRALGTVETEAANFVAEPPKVSISLSGPLRSLHIMICKPSRHLPKSTAHWALFIPDQEGGSEGVVYSMRKAAFANKTQLHCSQITLGDMANLQSVIVVPEVKTCEYLLSAVCHEVNTGRSFNLITRNCQHWVFEVIERLVERQNIPEGEEVLTRIKGRAR